MNKEILDKARTMLGEGYNLNQVAAILCVDKTYLSSEINKTPVEGLSPEKPKKKSTPKMDIDPLFTEEPGI